MPIDWFPLWLSLRVAALATLIALPVALGLAQILAKRRFHGKAVLEAVITLPLVLPTTVLAYYLLVLLGRTSALGRAYESVFGAPLLPEVRRDFPVEPLKIQAHQPHECCKLAVTLDSLP